MDIFIHTSGGVFKTTDKQMAVPNKGTIVIIKTKDGTHVKSEVERVTLNIKAISENVTEVECNVYTYTMLFEKIQPQKG